MGDTIQAKAADTLLERGVRFPIPAPFFLRLFGKKEISVTVRQPKLGTLIYISKGFVAMNIDLAAIDDGDIAKAYNLVAQHGDRMAYIMAAAILNGKWRIAIFSGIVSRFIKRKLTAKRFAELFMTFTMLSGVQHFTNTIRFLPSMNVMEKRNPSPADQGS